MKKKRYYSVEELEEVLEEGVSLSEAAVSGASGAEELEELEDEVEFLSHFPLHLSPHIPDFLQSGQSIPQTKERVASDMFELS